MFFQSSLDRHPLLRYSCVHIHLELSDAHATITTRRFIGDTLVSLHLSMRAPAFLCGENHSDRKQWIENRLRELVGIFAIEFAGFSVMDNHLHLLLRIDSLKAEGWSAEEVARRLVCALSDA